MPLKDPAGAVRTLDIQRLPADALAFYRPFHFSPLNEWGICAALCRLTRRLFARRSGEAGSLRGTRAHA